MSEYVPVINQAPPAADSALNATGLQVIGNKDDTVAGDSLVALNKRAIQGVGAISTVPSTATVVAGSAVTITAGAAGVAGAYAEVDDGSAVPAVPFRVVGLCLDTPSAALIGDIDIAYGGAGTETVVASIPVEVATDAGVIAPFVVPPSGVISASTRIAARATTVAGGETVNIRVMVQAV